jgi:predicted DsbA family dithiol-disulfide isomerase
MAAPLEVVEFTDPACPWAWGSEPKFRRLRLDLHQAGVDVRWRQVFGILFDTDDDPAPDPDAEAAWYAEFVAGITAHTAAPRPHRLAWVTRSSWPASLAAKAAEAQGEQVAGKVLRRLRETTFVVGRPADDTERVLTAVTGLPGLDPLRLARDMASPGVLDAVRRDWAETRRPCEEVLEIDEPGPHNGRAKEIGDSIRYALPTLRFAGPAGDQVVPGWRPLSAYVDAVRRVCSATLPTGPLFSAVQAIEWFGSMTEPELELLTGQRNVSAGAKRVDTRNGPLWIDPQWPDLP